jgi:hypothetical protein
LTVLIPSSLSTDDLRAGIRNFLPSCTSIPSWWFTPPWSDRLVTAAVANFSSEQQDSWDLNVQRLKQDSLDSPLWLWFEKAGDRSKQVRKESGASPGKEEENYGNTFVS